MAALGVYLLAAEAEGPRGARTRRSSRRARRSVAAATRRAACPRARRATRPTGAGIPKNFPRLAGQYADYTYAQLKAFKAGERGNDTDGKDANGTHHGARSRSSMTDAQMKAVAEYAAGLR